MTITITEAHGDLNEIKGEVVKALISQHGPTLRLISAQQACGIFDLTMKSFNELGLPKVDVLGTGTVIRYRLDDIEKLIAERTIQPMRKKRR